MVDLDCELVIEGRGAGGPVTVTFGGPVCCMVAPLLFELLVTEDEVDTEPNTGVDALILTEGVEVGAAALGPVVICITGTALLNLLTNRVCGRILGAAFSLGVEVPLWTLLFINNPCGTGSGREVLLEVTLDGDVRWLSLSNGLCDPLVNSVEVGSVLALLGSEL